MSLTEVKKKLTAMLQYAWEATLLLGAGIGLLSPVLFWVEDMLR